MQYTYQMNAVEMWYECIKGLLYYLTIKFHRFNRLDLVFCKPVNDLRPNIQFNSENMWCGRVIQLLSFKFRSEISEEPIKCECAYVHWLYDYTPQRGEHKSSLERGIKILYESDPPVVHLIPVNFIMGKLPVVKVGDCGRIPHHMDGTRVMARHNKWGMTDTLNEQGKVVPCGSQLYYVNEFAMTWSTEMPEPETE
jgi:hypothetical protein